MRSFSTLGRCLSCVIVLAVLVDSIQSAASPIASRHGRRRSAAKKTDGGVTLELEEIDLESSFASPSQFVKSDPAKPTATSTGSQTPNRTSESLLAKTPNITRGIHQIKSIYESVRQGHRVYEDARINTIRFVPSVKVETERKINFVFNLSGLTSTETIAKSELYVNNRYVRLKLAFNLYYANSLSTVKTRSARASGPRTSMTIDLSNYRNIKYKKQNGWQMFNVQDSLSSYMSARSRQMDSMRSSHFLNNSALFYYTYDTTSPRPSAPDSDAKDLLLVMEVAATFSRNSRRFKKFPSDAFNPYLMVYTSEDEAEMKNFFLNRIPPAFTELVGFKQTPVVVADADVASKKEIDAAWATFNKVHEDHDAEFRILKQFEEEVDRMNGLSSGAANEEPHEVVKTSSNEKNLINFMSIPKSTTKSAASTSSSTVKIASNSKYYYNYLPKADADLISTGIIDSTGDPSELKFFFNEINKSKPTNVFSVSSSKRKRDAANSTTNAQPKLNRIDLKSGRQARKKLSPSFDDLYDEREFDEQPDEQQQASEEIVPFRATIKSAQQSDEDASGSTFDTVKWDVASEAERKKAEESCRTRPMMIDFVDLSFSAWILEPKNYQSNYCGGTCKRSLAQKLTSSNYATLQGILSVLNMSSSSQANPSELCCTPSKTESLPILYVDTNSVDHVVKLLPDMIVKECACH